MIYIIIPVHNRKELTRACLESIRNQTYRLFHIIVVDDGSTDGTSKLIRESFPEVTLLTGNGNLWWAGSVNLGINHALKICENNDFILTLNDDLVLKPDYLNSIIETASSYPETIIGSVETTHAHPNIIKSGGVLIDWRTAKVSILNKGMDIKVFENDYVVNVSELTGRGTLFPVSVFKEIGLFDDKHIKQCADTELPIKAHIKFGYKLMVSYKANVITIESDKHNINTKEYYSLSDARDYFFNIRSHFNLMNRFWIARSIAPSSVWFIRYLTLTQLRTIGRFFVRLRFFQGEIR